MMSWMVGEMILTSHFNDIECIDYYQLLKTNELIEQLAGLTQDTRTHGTHFVMEGVERGNHL